MRIKVENFEMYVSHEELVYIIQALRRDLLTRVRVHWVRHQAQDWEKEEKVVLDMIRDISYRLGIPYEYDDLMGEVDFIFESYNKENENE